MTSEIYKDLLRLLSNYSATAGGGMKMRMRMRTRTSLPTTNCSLSPHALFQSREREKGDFYKKDQLQLATQKHWGEARHRLCVQLHASYTKEGKREHSVCVN